MNDSPDLLKKVVDSFKVVPFVSVRIVCFYSSQDLYQMEIDIKAQKRDQKVPQELQIHSIEGSILKWKGVNVEKAMQSLRTLPNKSWEPGTTSILVLITDSDGSFASQVASLPLANQYALFFGYKPEVEARIRQKLSVSPK